MFRARQRKKQLFSANSGRDGAKKKQLKSGVTTH